MGLSAAVLVATFGRAARNVRWILDDVDDEDCFWEPSPGCWSVRRRGDAGRGWGIGEYVCEDAWPAPDPLPLTTIAWRLAHLAAWTDVYRTWTFEEHHLGLDGFDVPGTRDGLVAWLVEAQDRFLAHVVGTDDDGLLAERPAHWGPHLPTHELVSTMIVEHIHHGAEIGLLRDLRRGHARLQPPPD